VTSMWGWLKAKKEQACTTIYSGSTNVTQTVPGEATVMLDREAAYAKTAELGGAEDNLKR
jgi:hypothetical protein